MCAAHGVGAAAVRVVHVLGAAEVGDLTEALRRDAERLGADRAQRDALELQRLERQQHV